MGINTKSDEPTVTFKASDPYAADAVRKWASDYYQDNGNTKIYQQALKFVQISKQLNGRKPDAKS